MCSCARSKACLSRLSIYLSMALDCFLLNLWFGSFPVTMLGQRVFSLQSMQDMYHQQVNRFDKFHALNYLMFTSSSQTLAQITKFCFDEDLASLAVKKWCLLFNGRLLNRSVSNLKPYLYLGRSIYAVYLFWVFMLYI